MRNERGTTLVELLVAITLVSFISVGMLMAMRIGLNAMGKTNEKLVANRKAIGVQKIILSQIAGLMPVTAGCGSLMGPKFVVFEGQPDHMRFVSSYTLAEAARGYPRLLEFKVIPGERGRGVRLVVNERMYGGPYMASALCTGMAPPMEGVAPLPVFPEIEVGSASFVLADKLAYCRFIYRRTLPAPEFERWIPMWPLPDLLPSGVRIEMAPLDPDPSKLQVLTVTAPIRVNKWVLGPYAD